MIRCPICGAKIDGGQETCPYCGEVLRSGLGKANWSELAGTDRQEKPSQAVGETPEQWDENPKRQVYYNYGANAEAPATPKKKSRLGLLSAALIVIFVAAIGIYVAMGGNTGDPVSSGDPIYTGNEDIDAFDIAGEYCITVIDEAILLETIGVDFANYRYEALVSGEYNGNEEDAKEAVYELHQDDIDSATSNLETIRDLYEEALDKAEDAGLTDLADAIRDSYDKLQTFFLSVIDFDAEYDDYADAVSISDEEMYYSLERLAELAGLA